MNEKNPLDGLADKAAQVDAAMGLDPGTTMANLERLMSGAMTSASLDAVEAMKRAVAVLAEAGRMWGKMAAEMASPVAKKPSKASARGWKWRR